MKLYYFVDKEGIRQGPLPLEDLKIYDIEPNTLIWSKGMEKWTKAKEIEELKSFFISITDTIIDKSEAVTNLDQKINVESEINDSNVSGLDADNSNDTVIEESLEDNNTSNKTVYIVAIVAIILVVWGISHCSSDKTVTFSDSICVDSVDTICVDSVDTIETNIVDEELIVREFIENMYNNNLFAEYRFLENHCTSHLLKVLRENYEDGEGYAVWSFRTSAQEGKPDTNVDNHVISVESLEDGWYTYEFYDVGWKGKKRVKASVVDGEVIMDVLETIYDECQESYNAEISKDWHLSGYMENDGTRFPIVITFHQQGDYFSDCIYKNVIYDGKLRMEVSLKDSYLQFVGHDGNKDFVIKLEQKENDNGWDGYSTIGEQTLFTHLEE